jgi:hypothetical protein
MDWDKSDDEREYESGDEEEEEEDIKQESLKTPSKPSDFKNTLLADRYLNNRRFLTPLKVINMVVHLLFEDLILVYSNVDQTWMMQSILLQSQMLQHQREKYLHHPRFVYTISDDDI